MRKRRGIDLAPRLGIGGAYPDEQADQTDDGGPKHAGGSSRATQPSWCAYEPASRLIAFTSLRSWRTIPQSGPSRWAKASPVIARLVRNCARGGRSSIPETVVSY